MLSDTGAVLLNSNIQLCQVQLIGYVIKHQNPMGECVSHVQTHKQHMSGVLEPAVFPGKALVGRHCLQTQSVYMKQRQVTACNISWFPWQYTQPAMEWCAILCS